MSTEISESEELAIKRQEIKDRIARARIWNEEAERRRGALHECIDRIENALPEQYETATRPMQDELGQLQDAAVEAAVRGEGSDPATEKRKQELREQIDAAGLELEESIASEEKRQKRLFDELKTWQLDIRENVISVLESKLAGMVSVEQKARHHALKQDVKFCSQWTQAAQKRLSDLKSEIDRPKERFSSHTRSVLQSRLPRFEAEVKLAGERMQEAQKQSSDLYQTFLED